MTPYSVIFSEKNTLHTFCDFTLDKMKKNILTPSFSFGILR